MNRVPFPIHCCRETAMSRLALCLSAFVILISASPLHASWIGITVQDDASGKGAPGGVRVTDVSRDSPGARAGLKAGDVILSANGIPIPSTRDFVTIVQETPPGKPIEMRVSRKGTTLAVNPIPSEPPADMADYQRGLENLKKGRNDLAAGDFTRALERNPGDAGAHYNRALAYDRLGKHDLAIADYTKVIQMEPRPLMAYVNRGYAYRNMKLYDQAIQDFSKAIEMEPKMAPAYESRASVYVMNGQYDEAIADCTRAIDLLPQMDIAYLTRANAYEKKGMKKEAAADYERAAEAYIEKGLEMAKAGKLDDAIKRFTSAIRLNTKHSPAAYYHRGVAWEKKGESLKAVNDYSEAVRLKPDYTEAYLRRGYVFAQKLGDYGKAKQDWEKASALDPGGETGEMARQNLEKLGKTK